MSAVWAGAMAWLEARPRRERLMVAATAGTALFVLASAVALDPLAARIARHEAARAEAVQQAAALDASIGELEARLARSPEEEAQREVARLTREVEALEARVAEAGADLLSPSEMNAALEALLASRPALRVLALETEASEPLLPQAEGGGAAAIHRHRGVLELEGDWESVGAALRELEALPWHIHWDALRYRVTEHPRARVTLRFHTLGTRAEWVGA